MRIRRGHRRADGVPGTRMSGPDLQRVLRVALATTGSAGRRECARIERALGDLQALTTAAGRRRAAGLRLPPALRAALEAGDLRGDGEHALAESERLGMAIVVADDVDYPVGLVQLANPPLALWVRGTLPKGRTVGVVGARHGSRYGTRQAHAIAAAASAAGVTVISGLARGVDGAAHDGALEGVGGTVAVLGSGLARIYPPEHRGLADRIAATGALISEFPPDTPPLPNHFPRRNRILAALSDALVVVEARLKSGALITARWAADLGREVFALPGQVDSLLSAGTLALLRDGARLLRDFEDLRGDLGWEGPAHGGDPADAASDANAVGVTRDEARLLATLDHEPMPLDEILARLDVAAGEALTRLCSLELRGLVEQTAGLGFRRVERSRPRGGSAVEEVLESEVEDGADREDRDGHVDEQPTGGAQDLGPRPPP